MAKRFIYVLCLLIIFNYLCSYTSMVNAQDGAINDGLDDLDSFFDGIEETEEVADTPNYEQEVIKEAEEPVEQPKLYYPPPEPFPEFKSDTEKYIYYARKYMTEICLGLLVIVYLANFFVGKKVNAKIVTMWLSEAIPFLKDNFHHIGFGEEPNLSLSQISYTEYEFYASGRDNCHYLFMNLSTKKRQDVITGALFGLLWPEHDRLIFDIPIDSEIPLELLICRQQNVKNTQQEMPNINQLITPIKVERFNNTNIAVLAENGEIVDIVLNKR